MLQVRYVSGGLLFLKPLGTFLTMLPKPVCVNDFWMSNTYFQQIFFGFISVTYGGGGVDVLWIKQERDIPFLRY
jgi:hypothetical protein